MTLPELAKQAAAEIGRWYGRTERFDAPPQRRVPCDEFLLEHWRQHPRSAPKADSANEVVR